MPEADFATSPQLRARSSDQPLLYKGGRWHCRIWCVPDRVIDGAIRVRSNRRTVLAQVCPKADRIFNLGDVAKRALGRKRGASAMNFIAGLQSSSDPEDEAFLKRIEALFRSRASLHLHGATGSPGEAKPST